MYINVLDRLLIFFPLSIIMFEDPGDILRDGIEELKKIRDNLEREIKLKKLIDGVERIFISHEAASVVHVEPLARLLLDNPDKAIEMIISTYNGALDDAYTNEDGENVRGFVEAIAGGPMEAIPSDVYNAVGAVYPFLDRERRDKALGKVLSILDGINYAYVQTSHTPFIREPLLFSDLCAARMLYYPGLDEGKGLLKQFGNSGIDSFLELKGEIIDENGLFRREKVRSDFLVAYSLLRTDLSDFGEMYAGVAQPNFLDRTVKGITGMYFGQKGAEDQDRREIREEFRQILTPSVQDRVDYHLEQGDWVDHRQFN